MPALTLHMRLACGLGTLLPTTIHGQPLKDKRCAADHCCPYCAKVSLFVVANAVLHTVQVPVTCM